MVFLAQYAHARYGLFAAYPFVKGVTAVSWSRFLVGFRARLPAGWEGVSWGERGGGPNFATSMRA